MLIAQSSQGFHPKAGAWPPLQSGESLLWMIFSSHGCGAFEPPSLGPAWELGGPS